VRAAEAMERRRLLATSVKTALTYPAIVVMLSVCAVAFMLVGLIPKLRSFLAAFGRKLPPMTQALLDVSEFVETRWPLCLAVAVVAAGAAFAFYRWPVGRVAVDRGLFRVPVVGHVLRLSSTSTFARTLSTLLASGVRLTDALRVAEPLHGNRFVAARIGAASERVRQGSALAEPLGEGAAFTPMLTTMVAVGEASGSLDEVLDQVATFHEARVEAVIRRLSALLEPLLILFVGGIVAFVYLACFMAIYAIAGNQR
jgi:type II secretory pathway component PulF